jgi:uncharacterized damage-inducible protein DinB
MDLTGHFVRMAENSRWSNDRLLRAVLALPAGEFGAKRTSFFPSIEETLNHILSVDLYYFDALTEAGEGLAVFERFVPFAQAGPLAAAQAELDDRLTGFCRGLTAADLARRVVTDRGRDGEVPEAIADLLAHLFLHQIHHRGQVHAMLSGSSVPPPQLDEFFLDFDRDRRADEVERLGLAGS